MLRTIFDLDRLSMKFEIYERLNTGSIFPERSRAPQLDL
jgi:hypothetical protein